MHRERKEQRIKRIRKFEKSISREIISMGIPASAEYRLSAEPVPFSERENGLFRRIEKGEKWGETWESGWFRISVSIPAEWQEGAYALHLDFNGEALVYSDNGIPLYGLTNGSVFDRHYSKDIYRLPKQPRPGDKIELWVETAANHLFGVDREEDLSEVSDLRHGSHAGVVNHMELVRFDESLWHLWLDVQVLSDLIDYLPENKPRRERIVHTMCLMMDLYGDDPSRSEECRELLKPLWTDANVSDMNVTGIGHAHIDTGWLWPVRETVRKCARTFASQIHLLENYPEYVFGASQPQHYQFVKDNYPDLYKKIKDLVAQGRWEIQGGMWVEADCNIISGESMVRQFLLGKNFFKDEFGVDVTNLWLPDVFGYSAAMPQILRKSGVDFFMTQKISWNQYNKFPFHLFNWKGIDGTEIVTHFLPENDYNAKVYPSSLGQAQDRFNENHICDEFVSLFGIGNGGGGPAEEYVERGLRLQNLEGSPKWRFGRADEAFDRMKSLSPQLPTWSGELYLELHRGTLTSQALVKKYNRMLETKLRAVEYLFSSLPFDSYPSEELDRIWKNLLMNQFHDIIPGSSIRLVYEKAHEEYESMLGKTEELISRASAGLFEKKEESLVIVNVLSSRYRSPVRLPDSWGGYSVWDESGNELPVQREEEGTYVLAEVEPNGTLCLSRGKEIREKTNLVEGLILENDLIRYEFDKSGRILSAYDKEEGFEVMECAGNILSLYVDRPLEWDAWDVDIDYENMTVGTAEPIKTSPLAAGPVRQGIRFDMRIGESTIKQDVFLGAGSKRIDFETMVDWKENHRMLRTSFPVNVFAGEASYDIQFGYVKRPTHRNTSWDMARFEVGGHRYADLSDQGYGVALLNDCKYGYKILGNTLDLNLLRSPSDPDPEADRHEHIFTYSLLPHRGDLVSSSVMSEAASMNNRPLLFDGCSTGRMRPPCRIIGSGVSMETVKKAEKEDCLIIRMVEMEGRRNRIKLDFSGRRTTLVETDLMEWSDGISNSGTEPFSLDFTPFEIKTYKVSISN